MSSTPAGHPIAFRYFFWGEFAERCSFYGMRAILAAYLADRLMLDKGRAGATVSVFFAAAYLLPLAGGWIADRWLGKYWTIVGFSVPYVIGQLMMGIEDYWFTVAALALLAMGSGVIKPNITTLMGQTYDAQRPGQAQLRADAFAMYYFAINVGSFLSKSTLPYVRTEYGYRAAFAVPAVLMTVALVVFAAGRRQYAPDPPREKAADPADRKAQRDVLLRLLALFIPVTFFWAIFDQGPTTWVFFAKVYTDCRIFGRTIAPDQMQALNPLFIMCLLPLVTLFFKRLAARGLAFKPTTKLMTGFLMTAACMATMGVAGLLAGEATKRPVMDDKGQPVMVKKTVVENGVAVERQEPKMEDYVDPAKRITIWWQVLAYVAITTAEILISVTGLEFAYAAAPPSMKSFVTACWLATTGLANLVLNVPFSLLYPLMRPGPYYLVLFAAMLVVILVFHLIARNYERAAAGA